MPPWLKDRRYLNPLLTSYDNRMMELETKEKDATNALSQLQKQVGARSKLRLGAQQSSFSPIVFIGYSENVLSGWTKAIETCVHSLCKRLKHLKQKRLKHIYTSCATCTLSVQLATCSLPVQLLDNSD